MKMRYGTIILIALASSLLLSACGNKNNEPPKLMKAQRDMLDKAKGVEDTVQQQAAEQNKEISKQSQ
jgi:hypothetical protein